MRRSVQLGLSLAVVTLLLGSSLAGAAPAPSREQGPYIISGAIGQFYGYLTPAMMVEKGGELSYLNLDIVQHDVVQDVEADEVANKRKDKWCRDFKKGECPLFWSARAGLGDTVPVQGLKNVKPGNTYTFFCTLHPGMKGTLVVAP